MHLYDRHWFRRHHLVRTRRRHRIELQCFDPGDHANDRHDQNKAEYG
jgi:hypothetical protein